MKIQIRIFGNTNQDALEEDINRFLSGLKSNNFLDVKVIPDDETFKVIVIYKTL